MSGCEASDGARDVVGTLRQVRPRKAEHGPTKRDEGVLPCAVTLEALDVDVVGHTVHLDRYLQVRYRDVEHCDQGTVHPELIVRDPTADATRSQYAMQPPFRHGRGAVA